MAVFEQTKDISEDIFEHASDYVEARWNLGVLNASSKAANGLADLTIILLFILIAMVVLLFMSLSTAWLLGQYFNSMALGFFGVGVFYVIAGILLWFIKDEYIKLPLINSFLKKFYSEDEDRKY
ncbi:hypothetical protein [Arcicella rosea]|uniref:Zn-dependent protease with chaperone function n=1 Tax=Arcicella rosea TaxID=502909 RepID=A0A841EFR6_9BACT|nr:hypothetical protein [Arcicella rosea]MBB6001985.1 Zn-dependent protease with chaperone function [Arcicella rosea]